MKKKKKWINTRKVYTKAVEINRRTVLREWIQKTVENEKELMQHHHNPPSFQMTKSAQEEMDIAMKSGPNGLQSCVKIMRDQLGIGKTNEESNKTKKRKKKQDESKNSFEPNEIGNKIAKRLFGKEATVQNIKEFSSKLDLLQTEEPLDEEEEEEEPLLNMNSKTLGTQIEELQTSLSFYEKKNC